MSHPIRLKEHNYYASDPTNLLHKIKHNETCQGQVYEIHNSNQHVEAESQYVDVIFVDESGNPVDVADPELMHTAGSDFKDGCGERTQVYSENFITTKAAEMEFQSLYIQDKEKYSEITQDQVCEILISDSNTNEIDLHSKPTDGEDQHVYNESIDPSLITGLDDFGSTGEYIQVSCNEDLFKTPVEIRDQPLYNTIVEGGDNSIYLQLDDLNLLTDLDLPVGNDKDCTYECGSEAVVGEQESLNPPQSVHSRFIDEVNEMEPVPMTDFDLYSELECTVTGNEDVVD